MKAALIAEGFDKTKMLFQTICISVNNPFYAIFIII